MGRRKKFSTARAHFGLESFIAMARAKPNDAVTEYKLAVDGSTSPDPIWMIRLGNADNVTGKYDDAIAVLDKVIAIPDLDPQFKNIAQNEEQMR